MQYLRAFARFWWVIGLCVVAGFGLPAVMDIRAPTSFESSTSILLSGAPANQQSSAEAYQVTLLAQQRMASYKDIASSPALAEKVLEGLGTDLTTEQLTDRTTSAVQANSTVLKISVTDTDAHRAQLLASRSGEAMVSIINRLEKDQAKPTVLLQARVVSEASDPLDMSTSAWRNPALSGVAGLLAGLGLAVALARFDPRLREREVVTELVGAPVFAELSSPRRRPPVLDNLAKLLHRRGSGEVQQATYAEKVRELRTDIFFLRRDTKGCLAVALTGLRPDVRVQQLAAAVATSMADAGAKVLLVDADLQAAHPSPLTREADASSDTGLASLLCGTSTMDDIIGRHLDTGVDVIAAGHPLSNAAGFLHSAAFAALLERAATEYDFVLVTAPPALAGSGATTVAASCDATIVTVGSEDRASQLRESLRQLENVGVRPSGAVILA